MPWQEVLAADAYVSTGSATRPCLCELVCEMAGSVQPKAHLVMVAGYPHTAHVLPDQLQDRLVHHRGPSYTRCGLLAVRPESAAVVFVPSCGMIAIMALCDRPRLTNAATLFASAQKQ